MLNHKLTSWPPGTILEIGKCCNYRYYSFDKSGHTYIVISVPPQEKITIKEFLED